MNKRVLFFLALSLYTIESSLCTMGEKPLKNKKIQQFEIECERMHPILLKMITDVLLDSRYTDIKAPLYLSRPQISVDYNDPTELLIYTEKLKIMIHQLKENSNK